MVFITEEMVRKRAEHNNMEISTLEELSLHQQDIEKIEHIDRWCRNLKILYLQSNLIARIENVSRLKRLQYLNLALNNIEHIENLEACESLEKLDLTINFVGELTGVETLKNLEFLKELFLTGNPCTDFEGYKSYVVATLRQLKRLDGNDISKAERIRSTQEYHTIRPEIVRQQRAYARNRQAQKAAADASKAEAAVENKTFDDAENDAFWKSEAPFTPESRTEIHQRAQARHQRENPEPAEPKGPRRLFHPDGRPMNVNEAGLDFCFTEDETDRTFVLDLSVYRHLDTSLIDLDVQTTHVSVRIKGKIFQLCLPAEVSPDSSKAERSTTTGHLVVTMPRADGTLGVPTPWVGAKKGPTKKAVSKGCQKAELTEKCSSKQLGYDFSSLDNHPPPLEEIL